MQELDLRTELRQTGKDIAGLLTAIGLQLYGLEQYEAALPYLLRAEALAESSISAGFSSTLRSLSAVQSKLGDSPSALAIDQRIFGDDHLNIGISYFNLACIAALADHKSKAFGYLRKVIDLEYPYDDLNNDSDLDSLRDEPEFQALLKEHQAFLQTLGSELDP